MTREEATQHLRTIKIYSTQDRYTDEAKEALDMAVEALGQEPCEDCISRKAVLGQTYLWSKDEFLRVTNPFDYLRKRINSLPPVTLQPKTRQRLCRTCIYGDKTEYDKPCTIYSDNCQLYKVKILDKIRVEIESCREDEEPHLCDYRYHRNEGLDMALDIIDKYKAESEDKE